MGSGRRRPPGALALPAEAAAHRDWTECGPFMCTWQANGVGPIPYPKPRTRSCTMKPSSRSLITNAVDLGTVLGIWAHPDDEASLSAGLMPAASDAGQRVVCVTATLGEHGTDDPQRWPPPRLARVRTHETRA